MNAVSLPVVHPSFQNLKRNGRFLHLVAAAVIITHAVSHFNQPDPSKIYLACLLLIAIDILILVFAVRNALTQMPLVNLLFRAIECFFFAGIGLEMMMHQSWISGSVHLLLAFSYSYLFYCEKKLKQHERVNIHHTGITVPALPESRFFIWSHISSIDAGYSSITIHTSYQKSYHFELQQNLQFEELDQIHEFCRHYLGAPAHG